MKLKDYLLWGGIAFGAWWILFRKKTAEQIVAEAVGPKAPSPIAERLSQSDQKAVNDWVAAFKTAFPQLPVLSANLDGELVCITFAQGRQPVCSTKLDAMTLGIQELVGIARDEMTRV